MDCIGEKLARDGVDPSAAMWKGMRNMPEKCTDGGCPYLYRIEALEDGQQREEKFRKAYYEERESRIERDVRLDAKISEMDKKLDKVVAWQEAQQAKPGKRWEGLVEKALWAVAAAVIAFLLAKIGL